MSIHLRPIADQTIVITGASSGIGLATARMAAHKGAKLMLAARSEPALRHLADEINQAGGRAAYVVADVGNERDVEAIAEAALASFGRFDTWINNAGVSIYGELEEIAIDEMKRLFDTNFWGVVYGSRVALPELKRHGGALINVGSTASDRAIPLQGIYSASKHAIKGFTDGLRVELEKEEAPVSVTLIKPGPIDTPYTQHARNYLDAEPKQLPPVYTPELVAKAILYAAEHPVRDLFVGSGGKFLSVLGYHAPDLTDALMRMTFFSGSKSNQAPDPHDRNGLEVPTGTLDERGTYPGHVRKTSLYTEGELHSTVARLALAGMAGLVTWRVVHRH
jgi:NADP-dependent 3-hydroxy acid dehydrogenase YdfG